MTQLHKRFTDDQVKVLLSGNPAPMRAARLLRRPWRAASQ